MNYHAALNKTLALILWAKDNNGEDDVVVFSGVLTKSGNEYILQRASGESSPVLDSEWLERIEIVKPEPRETLMNCEFQLSLSVSDIGEKTDKLKHFGLKWPE